MACGLLKAVVLDDLRDDIDELGDDLTPDFPVALSELNQALQGGLALVLVRPEDVNDDIQDPIHHSLVLKHR